MTRTVNRDAEILAGEYPDSWDDFIGQETAKRMLRVRAASARARGARLEHILLDHPDPGIGKTSLALLIAREMGVPVSIVSDRIKANEARILFSAMEEGSICIYDEVHLVMQGGQQNASWLLHYLENGVLLGPRGVERGVPQVTIIGTTTDAGKLSAPILQRFGIRPALTSYTDDEGTLIAGRLAGRILVRDGLPPLTAECAREVALAGSNRPRPMRDLLSSLRDLAIVGEIDTNGGAYPLDEALEWAGLTRDGLTQSAQDLLTFLYADMAGAPAGRNLIRERLGLFGTELSDAEGLLVDRDLIINTPQGRLLTQGGIVRAKALMEGAAA